jgi:radical SAM enzyme (TIGR01210 family)
MPSTNEPSRALITAPPGEGVDAWILRHRPARHAVDPAVAYAALVEPEHSRRGTVEDVATIFLTNRECPFRCLMCDLWKNTTTERVAPGAIPGQIRSALDRLPPATAIKLYNSGNFFDAQAIPPEDHAEIARLAAPFETVIVECHPRLVGRSCLAFRDRLRGELDVAMGLETVHPEVLPKLNKRMTLDDFARAAGFLRENSMYVRAFILLRPPFLSDDEGVEWARRSIDFAFDVGVECCAVIPTRGGNGVMELLAADGRYAPPSLEAMEDVLDYGLSRGRGRVFVDLWDIDRVSPEAPSRPARIARLADMNLTQRITPPIA